MNWIATLFNSGGPLGEVSAKTPEGLLEKMSDWILSDGDTIKISGPSDESLPEVSSQGGK